MIEQLSTAGLVFGGCCANVFALENILKRQPDSGILITFVQFALVALVSSAGQLSHSLSRTNAAGARTVPIRVWTYLAILMLAINVLNNWAFAFHISVPVHIILRSFGPAWAMLAKYIKHKKRYTNLQISSIVILSAGIILSAWADTQAKSKAASTASAGKSDAEPVHTQTSSSTFDFVAGLLILLAAQIVAAYQGIYTDEVKAKYTASASDQLFYTHLLALPFFLPIKGTITRQYDAIKASPALGGNPSFWQSSLLTFLPRTAMVNIAELPSGLVNLTLNAITQLVCITGVNSLAYKTSAVTVTVVLNVRKLVSFVLSMWLFGHAVSGQMVVGASLVFAGGALYGLETSRVGKGQERPAGTVKEKAKAEGKEE